MSQALSIRDTYSLAKQNTEEDLGPKKEDIMSKIAREEYAKNVGQIFKHDKNERKKNKEVCGDYLQYFRFILLKYFFNENL